MPSFAHSTVLPVSLERPARYRVLRSYAGHLEFGPDSVYDCLLRLLEENAETRGHLATNAAERLAVVQGAWWYRGEYVLRSARGPRCHCRVTVRVSESAECDQR